MKDLNVRKRIATYERTSSEDQRERATIKTQTEEIARRLQAEPEIELVERYVDDGVSGTIPMAKRPAGSRFMQDATRGLFQEVWVYRIDRLGRDDIDPLVVWRELEQYGVKVYSVTEGVSTPFEYTIRVAMNAEERRTFLARSADGLARAAREGRYTGGIVPYGYVVQGKKSKALLAPSTAFIWGKMTEAEVVVWIYERLALNGWSCRHVADELNRMGVPTSYARDGRLVKERGGKRKKKTREVWTAGRIRNMVIQPVYRGELLYGRRSKLPGREVIAASVPALVSDELWQEAHWTLARNRIMAKNTERVYLLRSVIRCKLCGLNYCGSWQRDTVRYRCDGQLVWRAPFRDRCRSLSFKGEALEPQVWADLERWLRNPGDLLQELVEEQKDDSALGRWEEERVSLVAAIDGKRLERDRLLDAYQEGALPLADLKPRMDEVEDQVRGLEERLAESDTEQPEAAEPLDEDLLSEIRRRLDAGLDDQQRREIVRLLVKEIIIDTEFDECGRKRARAVVTYNFPRVVDACRGRGSWRPPA